MQPRYYRSSMPRLTPAAQPVKKSHTKRWLVLVVLIALIGLAGYHFHASNDATTDHSTANAASQPPAPKNGKKSTSPVAAATGSNVNHCADNALDQNVIVSISARHLWVCGATKQLYDSPVVTGISYLAADVTPTGTYHVYAKERNLTLTGSDSTGSWSDPVSYWMPFLYNQYGAYGFHDATWRANSAFGNISPNSADASHGCVELPLATAAWIYNWSQVGTTVTIDS